MLVEKRSIAWRSGASSITISRKSPPIGAGPTTRMTSLSLHNSVSNASTMARCHGHVAHVDVVMDLRRHVGDREQAALRAHLHRHRARADAAENLPRQVSGTMPLGAASSTSAAVWAAASRSLSQLSRKLAIDGT